MGSIRQKAFAQLATGTLGSQADEEGLVLMVGAPQSPHTLNTYFPHRTGDFFIEFSELTPELLSSIGPMSVVAPVLTDTFDCLNLADFLTMSGYKGMLHIIARGMPRPDMIKRELRTLYPNLDLDVLRPEDDIAPAIVH
ncbi:hypothetical protein [Celeribacter sp. ULVN23_4]